MGCGDIFWILFGLLYLYLLWKYLYYFLTNFNNNSLIIVFFLEKNIKQIHVLIILMFFNHF